MRPAFRRGSVLIIALWIIVALVGLVLVMSYSVRVEAGAIANRTAQARVDAAERGAEQFVLSLVAEEVADPGASDDYSLEARQIGECLFWIIKPDYGDDSQIAYGLTDEGARLDLNTATREMLINLPGMADDLADCIIDWRDEDSTVSEQGAENEQYLGLTDPYQAKNGPFESVDELLLVNGFTPEILYGYDRNRNGVIDDRESQATGLAGSVNESARGIAPSVTAWGLQAASSRQQSTTQPNGPAQGPAVALLNINHAPAEVLQCLPGLTESDVSTIIAKRDAYAGNPSDTSWLTETLGQQKANAIAGLITGTSKCFSAEIVVVSSDGRAFKRCRVVVDANQSTPRIVYRKDLTGSGWPLAPEIREQLRAGQWQSDTLVSRGAQSF